MTDDRTTCDRTRDVMAASIPADAIGPDVAEARSHLEQCGECRAYLKGLRADDHLLAAFGAAHADRIDTLRTRTLAALPDPPVRRSARFRRWLRSTPIAAALAVGVFLVVFLQGPDASFQAWADVVETVRRATSSSFRLRDMGGSDVEARQTYSPRGTAHRTYEKGELVEALFVDFEGLEMVYMAYPLKLAARMTMDEAMADSYREHDPANTFDFLSEYEHEDLGSRRIRGRRAAGIRVTDARFLAQRMENAELELWVDPETRLPLRFDVTGDSPGRGRPKHVRFYDFVWNASLPDDEFRPRIPSDFDVVDGGHLAIDEQRFLEGLDLFADVVGRYPASLSYEPLKTELWRSPGARERSVGRMVVQMFRIRLASEYYGRLIREERGVTYHGATVRPGDADRVLMRWREGELYRVVFGDLTTDLVEPARMLELEERR